MLLRLMQNLQLVQDTLADGNTYRMYSNIVTEGLNFAVVAPDTEVNSDQSMLDINQVRILPLSHKYHPSRVHAGLLIYSVDGQTDFVLNDVNLRIKTGDIIIHQIHNALSGQEDVYRDLIRTLFGTHRINLVGLVFTFSGEGQLTDCMRWRPNSSDHTALMHPTEQKLLEIVLVSLYMNHNWLTMPIGTHVDVEELSRNTKKQYLYKLGEIEQLFNKRRQERDRMRRFGLPNFLKHHSADDFHSFEWTPSREQLFDQTIQRLLDEFYNTILQTFRDGEFDRDEYAYFDDNTKQLFSNLINPYAPLSIQPYSNLPRNTYY
ncbi:unnamed protein product [Adineta ricciae]|uniref:Uncharacterized protein n=1 Tax=Adineta ricciae TaxID=249248 RepID=A0A814I3B6_ADIRI|nr:unnamed protein product [Adineta ricciae]